MLKRITKRYHPQYDEQTDKEIIPQIAVTFDISRKRYLVYATEGRPLPLKWKPTMLDGRWHFETPEAFESALERERAVLVRRKDYYLVVHEGSPFDLGSKPGMSCGIVRA